MSSTSQPAQSKLITASTQDSKNQQHHPVATEATTIAKPLRKANQSNANSCRKTRQLRMFKVILVIMTTFFVCRLPTWIFLLIKLNRDLSSGSSWVLHFSLGMLSLANCAINPFLYTFLTETIRFGSSAKERLKRICCWCTGKGSGSVDSLTVTSDHDKLNGETGWRSIFSCGCCWEPCGKEELPDDKNLIDHCESSMRQFRKKSYTLNGKEQVSCISSHLKSPFGQYSNVYLGANQPAMTIISSSDPNHFVEVDLMNRRK